MKATSYFVRLSCVGLILFFAGCTAVGPDASFKQVQDGVFERTARSIVWNQSTKEDVAVTARIKELLQGTLSLDEAIEVSLLNNRSLQAEYEELGIAQAELVKAGLLQNPVLSIERRFRGRAAEVDISQDFLRVFLIPLRTRAAAAERDAVIGHVTQLVINHTAEVKHAFFALQAAQQEQEMQESVVQALEASNTATAALRTAGNVSDLQLAGENNLLVQAKLASVLIGTRVLEERERLNVLLGVAGDSTAWRIDDRLPNPPADELILDGLESYALTHRYDLQAAKKELESIAALVGIAKYEAIIPDISITGHFEREPEGSSTTGPSIGIPLPLFNWGGAASAQGNARFRQAQRRLEALMVDMQSKVRLAFGRMKFARERVGYYFNEVLPLQERMLEQSQLFYNGMFVGVVQLLQVKQAQINAGQSYIEALKDYWIARTDIEQALGGNIKDLKTREIPVASRTPMLPDKELNEEMLHKHHHHRG